MRKQPRRTSRFSQVFALLALTTITGLALTATSAGAAGVRFGFVDSVASWFGGGATVNVVAEPQAQPASINLPNATTVNIDFAGYTAAGFQAVPTAGQLDSDDWAVSGWSDGTLAFGGTRTTASTDYTRGATAAAQTTGGFYAYTGPPGSVGNPAFMIQPGGSDFAPGTLTLRLQNTGATAITQIDVSYDLFVRNDQGRSSSFNFSHSADDSTYTSVAALDYTSPTTLDALGWVIVGTAPSRSTTITGLNIAPSGFYYIRWSGADVGGSGSRDEFGLDNIAVTPTFAVAAPTTQASDITFSSVTANSMTVNWMNGNGSKRIVTMNTTNTFDAPADGTDPSANTTYGGIGQQVIYNGTGSSVAISGLSASTNYHFRVYEGNGSGATSAYNTATATDNPRATATGATPTAAVTGSTTICAGGSGTVTVTVSGGVAPYTVVLTNGGGTQSGAGPTFNFPVSPGSTTGYTLAAGSVDASSTAITTFDTATITVNQPPTPSNAGPNQTVVGSTATLAGNTPSVGTGTWSIVTGVGGSFTSPNNPNSDFTGLPGFIYTLRWTISNAPCSSTTDDVVITLNKASTSLANLTVNSTEFVGNSLAVSTTLTRTSPPSGVVAGEMVTFTLTGPSPSGTISNLSSTTNGSGSASVNFPLTARGAYTINASYAGNSTLNSSTSNTPSVSVYQRTSLAFSGGSGAAGSPITLSATLTQFPGGAPISGESVTFDFGGTPANLSATTNASGVAMVTPTFPTGGTFSTTASFSNPSNFFADAAGIVQPTTATANVNVTGCVTDPVVLNSGDAGAGSLRQAVIDACAGSTITFGDGSGGGGTNFTDGTADTITTASQITIDKNLTIEGQAANLLSITYSGPFSGVSRVFRVNSGVTATLSKITISGGQVTGGEFGGGIWNIGTLTLANTTVSGNRATAGGGIANAGSLTVNNSTVSDNLANVAGQGGGIYSNGALTVTSSTISNNSSTGFPGAVGGGIHNNSGTPGTITNSTISGNSAVIFGGGLNGAFTVTNSTIHGNSTSDNGAGFRVSTGQTLTINNSTITGNTTSGQGGGVNNNGGTVISRSSIFAGNTATTGPDFSGTLTSQGYNLIGNDAGNTISGGTNDIVNPAGGALLGPLANNGGPTLTQALLAGSPAIDKGINAVVPLTNDQRGAGFARTIDNPAIAPAPSGDNTDIGAYEAPPPPTVTSVNPTSGPQAGGNTVTITGTNFTGATGVTFDALNCPITSNNGTEIVCTAPPHGPGAVSVIVTTPGGTNAANTLYTYVAPSEITVTGNGGGPINDGDTGTLTTNGTDFGPANVTAGTVDRVFVITNDGTGILTLDASIAIGGTNLGDFAVQTDSGETILAPAATRTFSLRFDPSATGLLTATVSFGNNDADENPFNFAIQGTGIGTPEMEVRGNGQIIADNDTTPATGDHTSFGNYFIGNAPIVRTYTIFNIGGAPLSLTASPKVVLTGTHASDFTIITQPLSPVAGPSGSTTFQVRLDPASSGFKTATVSIAMMMRMKIRTILRSMLIRWVHRVCPV